MNADFTVSMTSQQAKDAKILLNRAGIKFDPLAHMTISNPEDDTYGTMDASELPRIIDRVNDHLAHDGPGREVPYPKNFEQTADALRFAYNEFEWRKWDVYEDLWKEKGNTWESVKEKYPALFGPRA